VGSTVEEVLGQAHAAARAGRWREARRLFRKAAVETTPLPRDRARVADARRWCSIAGMRLGDWTHALEDVRHSIAMSTRLADVQREAKSLNVAGAVEFERGDWVAALDLFEKARVLARSVGDRLLLAKIDNNEGAVWDARGVPARARRLYASALAGFRATNELGAAARVMNNLGLSMAEERAHSDAVEWYEKAAETARGLGMTNLLLTVLINLSSAAAESGRASLARAAIDEARALAEQVEGEPVRADLCCALAKVARLERRWEEAERWCEDALRSAGEGRNPLAEGDAWEQYAHLRRDQGRLEESRATIERARARYQILGARAAAARAVSFASELPVERTEERAAEA
jgi:tetratricopeptide (TPR) repeat protein